VAVIPLIVAAAAKGAVGVATVIIAYEIATIATMVLLVSLARIGVSRLRAAWLDRFGHAVAGAVIVSIGVLVQVAGI
jgi:hypothetical protein